MGEDEDALLALALQEEYNNEAKRDDYYDDRRVIEGSDDDDDEFRPTNKNTRGRSTKRKTKKKIGAETNKTKAYTTEATTVQKKKRTPTINDDNNNQNQNSLDSYQEALRNKKTELLVRKNETTAATATATTTATTTNERKKPTKSVYNDVDLKTMMSLGLLKPGLKRIAHNFGFTSLEKQMVIADLLEDGTIHCAENFDDNGHKEKDFKTPASFSMYIKRLTNPEIKFTDGWGNVKYDLNSIDEFKEEENEEKEEEEEDNNKKVARVHQWVSLKVIRDRIDKDDLENIIPMKTPPEPRPKKEPKPPKAPKPPKEPKPPKPSPKKKKRTAQEETLYRAQKYIDAGPSLARDKPRREIKKTKRNYGLMGNDDNEYGADLHMVSCENYREPKVRRVTTKGAQPFDMLVSPACLLVMDYHSHLCSNEIIGFLGGTWDGEKRMLRITRALPARQLSLFDEEQANAGQEVELDPSSVPDIVERLDANNERVVGWYHSHPIFPNHPSLRDIENQSNYQRMFNDAEIIDDGNDDRNTNNINNNNNKSSSSHVKNCPFVGAIVGPYDLKNPSSVSDIRYFHVCSDDPNERNPRNFTPFQLEQEIVSKNDINDDDDDNHREELNEIEGEKVVAVEAKTTTAAAAAAADKDRSKTTTINFGTDEAMREMKNLTERFKPGSPESVYVESISMNEVWKAGETKVLKLEKSLLDRCPQEWRFCDKTKYVSEIIDDLKQSWGLSS
jgi:proteasome lid subunit RPN8/RPN11